MSTFPTFQDNETFYKWRSDYLAPLLIDRAELSDDDYLIFQVATFEYDPLAAALFLWSWGQGELENKRLQDWQIKVWSLKRDHLQNRLTRFEPFKCAICSGHGIGKTAFMAKDSIIEMATHAFTKGITTANTGAQLSTKTWAELQKWLGLSLVEHWFEYSATKFCAKELADQKRWVVDAVNWSKASSAAFAGGHNQGHRLGYKLDEASEIPKIIFEVVEGAMSDEDTQLSWFAFGNGTQNSGQFYDIFMTNYGHDWHKIHVDSRTVSITNKKTLQKQIDTHGIDSDFVKTRILGMFPSNSINQAIPAEYIIAAQERMIKDPSQYSYAPVIVGIDPSGNGGDELTVWLRQGCFCMEIMRMPKNNDDLITANMILTQCKMKHPFPVDAFFIDMGYGSGIYSYLKNHTKIPCHLISFASAAPDMAYYNIRAWMWLEMGRWLKDSGVLPQHDKISIELAGPRVYMSAGKMAGRWLIESKEDMRERDVPSPNHADALGLTFVMTVKKCEASKPLTESQKRGSIKSGMFDGLT